MPRSNRNPNPDISKRFQTELQSLVAYACYDSNEVLRRGTSAKREAVINKIASLYFPSNNNGGDRMSYVEMLLEGKGRFKYLFKDREVSSRASTDVSEECSAVDRIVPPSLYCIDGKEIKVEKGCIDKSLLTRKNLGNMVDIKALTLYQHAKDVEANFKKAMSFCSQTGSPYHNFNGTFPSGTNWEDYLIWIRQKMYDCGNKASVEDLLDGDTAQDEGDERDKEDEDGNNNLTDGNSNAADGTEDRSNANNATDASTGTKSTDGTDELPPGEYFKGFLAFALWGYIPPKGGERYKSILIKTVVNKVPKAEKADGRAAVKKEQK